MESYRSFLFLGQSRTLKFENVELLFYVFWNSYIYLVDETVAINLTLHLKIINYLCISL